MCYETQIMSAVTVERIELLAVGPDGERVTWSSHLGPMYEAMILARLFLSNGVEAIAGTTTYTEHEFDMTTFSASGRALARAPLGGGLSDPALSVAVGFAVPPWITFPAALPEIPDIGFSHGPASSNRHLAVWSGAFR